MRVGRGLLRSQLDRLVQLGLGLVQLAGQEEVDGQHFVSLGVFRFELDRPAKIGHRLFVFVAGHVVQPA